MRVQLHCMDNAPTDPLERLLDTALEQTFPASDPIAVDVPPARDNCHEPAIELHRLEESAHQGHA